MAAVSGNLLSRKICGRQQGISLKSLLRRERFHRQAAAGHRHRLRGLRRRPCRRLSNGQQHGQLRRKGRRLRCPAPAPLQVRCAGRIPSERGTAAPFCNEAPRPSPARPAVSFLFSSSPFRLRFWCFFLRACIVMKFCAVNSFKDSIREIFW